MATKLKMTTKQAAIRIMADGWKQDDDGLWYHPAYPDSPHFNNPLDALNWIKPQS
jgi:hypothetical protein